MSASSYQAALAAVMKNDAAGLAALLSSAPAADLPSPSELLSLSSHMLHLECAQVALAAGASPVEKFENDQTPLHLVILAAAPNAATGCSSADRAIKLLKVLLQHTPESGLEVKNRDGLTPMALAEEMYWPAAALELFRAGATPC